MAVLPRDSGLAVGRQPVDREIVNEVCRDFDLRVEPALPSDIEDEQAPRPAWTSGPVSAEPGESVGDEEQMTPPGSARGFAFRSRKG